MYGNDEHLLAEETSFYEENRDDFLMKYPNRHLLIKGREIIGSYETYSQAVEEGVKRFGQGPFLVRLAGADEPQAGSPALALGLLCQS